ncbi:MAG: sodium-dependent transporter [Verrucomicrobiota bacterium]
MTNGQTKEAWSSRMGVILAVAGSAVGLGNFLRFPGLAAKYGSGAFMIAYFVSLLLIGIPVCWAEWTLGRYAGQKGFRSSPGIFYALIRHPVGKYIGVLGVIIPVIIYMYYVYIEAWVAGYAWYFFFTDKLNLGSDVAAYADFWKRFIGFNSDGFLLGPGQGQVIYFFIPVFIINFIIIYRGLSAGIEAFCKYAMPALVVLAIIVLIRVLTLGTPDPAKPDQNVLNGLGYMWNPSKAEASMLDQLLKPELWLAAAGQIFFSLSVGFGVIITYASYLKEKDDVVLSGLTATSANEFCEVALGGMISVPAAFIFLGAAGVVGQGTFGLGFNVLPLVFSKMPLGWFFGGAFFFLLFLAAITSSLSMLQPGIAFLEEGLGLTRKQSVAWLGLVTAIGCLFVLYFSKDMKALDTMDFWIGTVCLFLMATVIIIYFGWVLGVERGWQEAHKGAEIRIPDFFKFIMKWVSPTFLIVVFILFVLHDIVGWDFKSTKLQPTGYVTDLIGEKASGVARLTMALVVIVIGFFALLTKTAVGRWDRAATEGKTPTGDKS